MAKNGYWSDLPTSENKVGEAKLSCPVFWSHACIILVKHYPGGGELLYWWAALSSFGAHQLKPFANVTSRCRLWWFTRFLRIHSELYRPWSTKHTAFFYECPVWRPMRRKQQSIDDIFSPGYTVIHDRFSVTCQYIFQERGFVVSWQQWQAQVQALELVSFGKNMRNC